MQIRSLNITQGCPPLEGRYTDPMALSGASHRKQIPNSNTIDVRNGWFDGNGMNSLYPAAVRIAYDPKGILAKLREMIATKAATNGFIKSNPHD